MFNHLNWNPAKYQKYLAPLLTLTATVLEDIGSEDKSADIMRSALKTFAKPPFPNTWPLNNHEFPSYKLGCVVRIVVNYILLHVEIMRAIMRAKWPSERRTPVYNHDNLPIR